MDLDVIRANYLKYSKRFKSIATYERYDTPHLNTIVDFMIGNGYVNNDDLDFDSIYDFIDQSKINNNSNKTINKRIQLLNRAIQFQVKQGICNPTIITSFPKLKEQDKRFDVVNEYTMQKVIQYLISLPNTLMNHRNQVIIFLFIDTGARLSEVTQIRIKNIDFHTNSILLEHTKAKRDRRVYFSHFTADYLKKYLDRIDLSSSSLLRNSKNNEPMNYLGVLRVFQKIKGALNLENFSSHMIRHSYGTLAYKLNASEFLTNNTMGHSRMDMTRRYIHYDTETNAELYQELAPMEYYINKK